MSTLRTNTLKTTDDLNVVAVADLVPAVALRSDLSNTADVAKGAGQIGRNDQIVNSITELRALLKTSASKFAFVNGYYVAGDGGGGQYYLDAADTTSADNGGTIIVATDGGRWKLATNHAVNVQQFGAKGDGVTDDLTAIRNAIAYAKISGVTLESSSGLNHFLGTFADSGDSPRFTIDFNGFTFNTNNCVFSANASQNIAQAASANQSIFKLQDSSDIAIGDFSVIANVIDRINTIGIVAVHIRNSASNSANIHIGRISGTKLVSCITGSSANPSSFRHTGLRTVNTYNTGGYYNVNCADNIDDFVGTITSNDGVRSYFVYGVKGHAVNVYSTNNSKFTDILIKRLGFDTRNIRVDFHSINDLSNDAAVSIEHQNDTDDGIIEDVIINLNVTKSDVSRPTLNFVSFTNAGAERTTTNSITNNITVRGNSNSTTPTVIKSGISGANNGENISRLTIDRDLLAGLLNYKRYIMLDGSRRRMAVSDSAGGMSLKFNVSEFKLIPNVGLLTLYAADNALGSAAEFIARTQWVNFSVNSTGQVIINNQQTIDQLVVGALGVGVTLPSGLNTFDLTVDISNYTGANRRVRGTLDVYSAFEM